MLRSATVVPVVTAGNPDRKRTGRPAGSPPNREAILAAARDQFAARGYESATIRGIAAAAGVDPALVHHYFGSKDQLFAAAIELPVSPSTVVPELLAGDLDGLGERLIRRFLDVWAADQSGRGGAMAGMMRSAVSHEAAARMVREFITREVLERIAEALQVPQPRLRAALVGSMLVGLAMTRFVIRVEPIVSTDLETLVACYAPPLQRFLTGPLPGDSGLPTKP
jgi:AcrR family transcriptional regulator